jgi:hypothetical protein
MNKNYRQHMVACMRVLEVCEGMCHVNKVGGKLIVNRLAIPHDTLPSNVRHYAPATSNRAIKYIKSLHKTISKRIDCKPVRGLDLINDLITFK